MTATELIHLSYEGNFQLKCTSSIVSCRFVEEGKDDSEGKDEFKVEVQLESTTMHPQGGGQPSDHGTISVQSPSTTFHIDHVCLDRDSGVVTHSGTCCSKGIDLPLPGSTVDVSVHTDRRKILSECHTAGHVVDSAMDRCGHNFPALKGYHFLDGPYVEYKGKLPPNTDKDEVVRSLQQAFANIVEEDIATTIQTMPKTEADALCNRLAQNFDFSHYGEKVRIVTVGRWPCPCGGTHVKSTGNLKHRGWTVTGIRAKKGVIRIKYGYEKAE